MYVMLYKPLFEWVNNHILCATRFEVIVEEGREQFMTKMCISMGKGEELPPAAHDHVGYEDNLCLKMMSKRNQLELRP